MSDTSTLLALKFLDFARENFKVHVTTKYAWKYPVTRKDQKQDHLIPQYV